MKKMSKGMLMSALICGAVYLVGTTPVYANELQEFALDEYVVTAARTETKLVDTPANISVVDAQTIEERHYQDVSEVLKDVPGANVMDNGHGTSEKVVRLNGDERVLILVDGRRISTEMGLTGSARANVDMNQLPDVGLIERIEVLKGAGGALYGSDAVGGVINIITKKANDNYGKVTVGYGSMGTEDYSAMYSFKEKNTGVTVAASKYEQDYYKYKNDRTNKTQRWHGDSDFTNEKISLRIDQSLNYNQNLTVGYDYSKFEGKSPSSATYLSQAILDKKTENMYAKYDWILKNNDAGYFQFYHNELDYNNSGNMSEKTNGLDFQQTISLSDTNKMVVGGSWRKSNAKSHYIPYGETREYLNYDDDIENLALFINDTWEFFPTWTINAGVRYDDHSKSGDESTLSFALNKKINDDSHAYISWNEVFKAPSTDDLYYTGGSMADTYPLYGDPNLKPETGEVWTIGYNTQINEKTYLGFSYFESDLEDAIYWDYYVNHKVLNLHKQEKRGMEITINHKFNDSLSLNGSYTYLKMKNDENGNGLVRDYNAIPNIYRLGLNYLDGKWNTNLWLRAGTGAETNSRTRYLDSKYITVDLSVTYQATKDISFYAKGYNLFNEAYAEHAGVYIGEYSYPAQSRRFIVGAEYKF